MCVYTELFGYVYCLWKHKYVKLFHLEFIKDFSIMLKMSLFELFHNTLDSFKHMDRTWPDSHDGSLIPPHSTLMPYVYVESV